MLQKPPINTENAKRTSMTVREAAENANVSTATIHNWIKTGYLVQKVKGYVELSSFYHFMENVAGKDKLVQRANKLLKDKHNHEALSNLLVNKLNSKTRANWNKISEEYEESLSHSYRNREGIYYTPIEIIDDMLGSVPIDTYCTFLDPCCGSGNFIIRAIAKGINPENVYGYDTDPNAVELTKKRIKEATGYDASANIKQLDFLKNAIHFDKNKKYDLIFTNPPWGKKINKNEKESFAKTYSVGTSSDTSSLFYGASIQMLKPSGYLGFLVQDALFNIAAFEDTRRQILEQRLLKLIDYDKPFKGLLSKACAFIIQKNSIKNEAVECCFNQSKRITNQRIYAKNPKTIFNYWTKHNDIIDHVYQLPHTTLKGKAKWGLGIVTGNNAKYCVRSPSEGYVPVYKGSDITSNGLKSPSNFIPDDFSSYQQVAPLHLYQAESKLIYKFISSQLVFYCDTEQRYILNSVNFLIPGESAGITCEQLADLLSSEWMNWLFRALFNTHKILRGDLELLPIHTEYFAQYDKFNEESYLDFMGIERVGRGGYKIRHIEPNMSDSFKR